MGGDVQNVGPPHVLAERIEGKGLIEENLAREDTTVVVVGLADDFS
jgi:hypothetical protein